MAKTVKVAQTSDLSPGTGKGVKADGRNIAVSTSRERSLRSTTPARTGAGRWAKAS